MLLPKRVKYRRVQRGRLKGKATRGNKVTNGDFGLQATEPAWITSNQIEAARIAMTRYIKRNGKVWIKIFPDKPITEKPAETRMGSGKGLLALKNSGSICSLYSFNLSLIVSNETSTLSSIVNCGELLRKPSK